MNSITIDALLCEIFKLNVYVTFSPGGSGE